MSSGCSPGNEDLAEKEEYDPPGVGTVFPLRSRYSEDFRVSLVRKIASDLESKGLIGKDKCPVVRTEGLRIRLDEFLDKYPVRKHESSWIDGGKQIAIFHPDSGIPFFPNASGSRICRLCDGKHTIGDMIARSRKKWHSLPEKVLAKDLMRFLLLLTELDLIQFTDRLT